MSLPRSFGTRQQSGQASGGFGQGTQLLQNRLPPGFDVLDTAHGVLFHYIKLFVNTNLQTRGDKRRLAAKNPLSCRRPHIDLRLDIGEINEVVSAPGAAPLLETQTSNLGQVVAGETIEDLPLNGRNFIQLALLSAGVTPAYSIPQRDTFVANGMRPLQNTFMLDGMENKTHRAVRRVAEAQYRPSVSGDSFEFSISKKADVLAVRRPEGRGCPLRSGEWSGGIGVEGTYPELSFSIYFRHES